MGPKMWTLEDNPHIYAKVSSRMRCALNANFKKITAALGKYDEHNYCNDIKFYHVDESARKMDCNAVKWNDSESYPINVTNFRIFAFKRGHHTMIESLTGYKILVYCKTCEYVTAFGMSKLFNPTLPKCPRCWVGYPLLYRWVQLSSGGNATIVEDSNTFKDMNYCNVNLKTTFSIIHNDCQHTQKIRCIKALISSHCIYQGDKTPEQYVGECVLCSNGTDNLEQLKSKVGRKSLKKIRKSGQFGEDQLEDAIVKFNKININSGIHFHLSKGFEGSIADFALCMNITDNNNNNNNNNNNKYDLAQMGIQCKSILLLQPVQISKKYNDNTIMYIISHPKDEFTISHLYVGYFKDFELTRTKTRGYEIRLGLKSKNQSLRVDPNQVGKYLLQYYLELAQELKLISYWSCIRPWKHANAYVEFKVYKTIQLAGMSSKNYDYRYNPNYEKIDNYLVIHIQKDAIELIDPIFIRWTCNVCNGMNRIEESKCTCCESAQDSSCNPKNMDEYLSDYVVACFNDQAKTIVENGGNDNDGKNLSFKVSYFIKSENENQIMKIVPYLIKHDIDGFNLTNHYDEYSFMVPSKLLINKDNPLEYRMYVPLHELNKDYSTYKYETKEGLHLELLCRLFGIKSDSGEKLSPKHIIPYEEPSIRCTKLVDLDNYISQ